MKNEFESVIIGMGPAGMAAATELCRLGVCVALVDEQPSPGGQVYRQPSPDFALADPRISGSKYKRGQRLIHGLGALGVLFTRYHDAYVWGAFDDHTLSLVRNNAISLLRYQKLLLCEGAMERSVPFPGWTLPGIMTLGGLQKLVVQEQTLPGQRFLLAGASPLLFPVAASILKAGGEVAVLCDAVPLRRYRKLFPEFLRHPGLAREALGAALPVFRKGVPVLRPSVVIAATGHSRVEAVQVARLGPTGNLVPGSETRFEVDIVGVSHGFLPSGRLARLCGCNLMYDPLKRFWRPETDEHMRSSLPDVYLAGDAAGIGGRNLAEIQGRLAATHIAFELGRISDRDMARQTERLHREQARIKGYGEVLHQVFSLPPGLFQAMDEETIVCRCEQVSLGDVLAGTAKGYRNINEIKRTRAAMGLCQGRICESIVTEILRQEGIAIEEIGALNLRPPLSPMPLSLFEDYARANENPR